MELVKVVAAPPTRLVKVPPTERVVLGERVKELALLSVVLLVDVAFWVMVQPPLLESKVRL